MASIDLIRASNGSGDAVKATVTNARVIGSTTLQVSSITNFHTSFIATAGDVDGTGAFVPASATVFTGHTSGGNIEIDSYAPGYTDIGNTPGQIVVLKPTTAWANEVADVLAVTHNQDGTLKNKVATLAKINGGSTDGVLLTDASGNVTGGKVTADKLDSASFIFSDSASWKVTALPSGKKQYSRVVVGSDVSIGGGATGAAQTVTPPTGISGTDILSGSYLITSTYTSNAAGWDRMIGKTSISSSTISLSVYNSTAGSLNTGNQARWFLVITEM